MNKFQVGDIVVGNHFANAYGITIQGCVIEVLENIDFRRFRGRLLEVPPNRPAAAVGADFYLTYDRFDLKEQLIQENE